jgi:PPK2 family polyphosphate:nucleotide phosphotransferase
MPKAAPSLPSPAERGRGTNRVPSPGRRGRARVGASDLPKHLLTRPGTPLKLQDRNANQDFGWNEEDAKRALRANRERLEELQFKLYADGRFPVLIVLQGIDAAGKDGTLRHVITAFNPQGCTVTSFKAPSAQELRHDYLWRIHRHIPGRGEIAVFNRSHYEDVLVVRVDNLVPRPVWSRRYDEINDFERMLLANDVRVIKFFLHISKDEQKKRFEARLRDPAKQWKLNPADLEKRKQWRVYREAFEAMLEKCSTSWAPWHVIPSNRKWFRNLAVSQVLVQELEKLPLRFPKPEYDPAKVRVR